MLFRSEELVEKMDILATDKHVADKFTKENEGLCEKLSSENIANQWLKFLSDVISEY